MTRTQAIAAQNRRPQPPPGWHGCAADPRYGGAQASGRPGLPPARANALWPRLMAFLEGLAARHRPLPYRPELAGLLGVNITTLDTATRNLVELRLIERVVRGQEARVVMMATGAVVVTGRWREG